MSLKVLAALAFSLALPCFAAAAEPVHDRAYWKEITAHDFAVPAGASAADLSRELATLVDSPDPELRDEFGYEILARWIHRGELTTEAIDALRQYYVARAPKQLGESGTDTVFGRSFSLLALKELAAADLKTPYLTQASFDELFELAVRSLANEHDLRGYVEGKGWAHATAHGADLLRILSRNPRMSAAQQAGMVEAIVQRTRSADTVFIWGEDNRLAAALATLLQRKNANVSTLEAWLPALQKEQKALWEGKFEPAAYRRVRAQLNLLAALCAYIAPLENAGLPEDLKKALYTNMARLN